MCIYINCSIYTNKPNVIRHCSRLEFKQLVILTRYSKVRLGRNALSQARNNSNRQAGMFDRLEIKFYNTASWRASNSTSWLSSHQLPFLNRKERKSI